MNSQNTETITAAGRYKWFDALVVHTERKGNELKNYGYESYDDNVAGIKREKADPYSIIRRSTLVKFGFQPTENHRFAVSVDNSTLKSEGQDLSYSLRPSKYTSEDSAKNGERRVHDSSKRESLQFSYETFSQTPFWDHLKLTYSTQKITNKARSDEYCQGSKCTNVRNPSNLQLVDNNGYEVKANGESINIDQNSAATTTSGKAIQESDFFDADSTYINCSILDCTKPFNLYQKVYNADTFEYSYNKVSRPITIKQLANKKGTYGVVEKTSEDQSLSKKTCYSNFCFDSIYLEKSLVYLLPKAPGYYSSDYNNRDLNTKTTQINLDFDKEFKLFNQLHSVKYGSLYNRIKKDMVNKQGWEGQEIQWWQQAFLGQKGPQPDPEYWMGGRSSYKRSRNGETSSYLIPVTTKNTALYFGDSFSVTNWLGFDLNWRYDTVRHLPNYRSGIDPEIPRGLLAGTMIPIPDSALSGGNGWYNYNHPDYIKNVQDNLNAIQKEAKFKHHSYNLGVNFDPINWLRVQLKYSNGFRAPTSDEMYMTFKHPQFSLAPNTNLKAETAKTKEIAFTFYKDRSYFTTNIFQTDYRNFIDIHS
ncbi:TonB-dependent receptor domain-containing protein [Haemophilus influenzae]